MKSPCVKVAFVLMRTELRPRPEPWFTICQHNIAHINCCIRKWIFLASAPMYTNEELVWMSPCDLAVF